MKTNRKEELMKIRSEIITADEAAEIIGVTRDTLLRYRKNGILNCIKAGGRVLYRLEDVKNFLTGGSQS
mgnify:CR=1 FL=1|jgi:excisionase family DNA binding protein